MKRIKSIKIENFRGIRSTEIFLDSKNLLLLGENGTGKSSIIDAIEFFFTGLVEKYKGRGDVKDRDCIQNANGGIPSVSILFSDESTPITINYPYHKPQVPDSLKDLFANAFSRPFIMHRAQLLRFIESQPSKRYQFVSDLIGLDQIDKIEGIWKEIHDDQESLLTSSQKNLRKVTDNLRSVFEQKIKIPNLTTLFSTLEQDQEIVVAVQSVLAGKNIPLIQNPSDIANVRELLLQQCRKPEDITRAEELRNIQRQSNQVTDDLVRVQEAQDALIDSQKTLLNNLTSSDDAIFETLLQEGKKVFEGNDLSQCPLCEHDPIDQDKILEQITIRLDKLKTLTLSRENFMFCKESLKEKFINLHRDLDNLQRNMSELNIDEQLSTIKQANKQIQTWKELIDKSVDPKDAAEDYFQTQVMINLPTSLERLQNSLSSSIELLAPNESEREIFEITDFLSRLDQTWSQWRREKAEYGCVAKTFSQVDLIYKELIEARKERLDEILTELQTDFIRIFEKLHPGEGFQAISLIVSPSKRSSIEMESTINGQLRMHPYGNFSEGHLDSLGICLFLAFIKRFNEDFKLIILDDILTSIDAGHRMRVARLLVDEFPDYQIILTTHDEMWANELRTVMSSKNKPLRFLRLKQWNLASGTDIDEYLATDWQVYEKLIDDGRKQDAIAGVGRHLEKFLITARRHFGIAIPATPEDIYTINDLYEPFFNWVEKHPFDRPDRPQSIEKISNLRRELDDYWRLRNWSGAHFNDWGSTVSSSEAIDFLNIVQELIDLFECSKCHSMVIYNNKAKLLHCPICSPSTNSEKTFVYQKNWRNNAQRELLKETEKNKEFALGIIKSNFEFFLRDMRWIANLAIAPVQGEKYHIEDIYPALKQWAEEHLTTSRVNELFVKIQEFLNSDFHWKETSELLPNVNELFKIIDEFVKTFECPICKNLMHFENELFCPVCSRRKDEIPSQSSAYWKIIKPSNGVNH